MIRKMEINDYESVVTGIANGIAGEVFKTADGYITRAEQVAKEGILTSWFCITTRKTMNLNSLSFNANDLPGKARPRPGTRPKTN